MVGMRMSPILDWVSSCCYGRPAAQPKSQDLPIATKWGLAPSLKLRERAAFPAASYLDRLLDQINQESATEPGYEPKKLSVTARKLLLDHPWPGNVRDALLPRPKGSDGHDPVLSYDSRQGIDLNGIIDRVARHYLEQAMSVTGGNKTRAARLLGFVNPTTMTNWLKKHGGEP